MPKVTYYWDEVADNISCEEDENGGFVASYQHQPGLHGELVSQERDGDVSYYHYDGQGNTLALADQDGAVTDTAAYTAYGETVEQTGSTVNPFGYGGAIGYYTNTDTADIYIRARTYAPSLGRWSSRDPIGFHEKSSTLYQFLENTPTKRVDPLGLYAVSLCGGSSFADYLDPVDMVDDIPVDDWKEVIGQLRASASIVANASPAVCGENTFLNVDFAGSHNKKFNPLTAMSVKFNDFASSSCTHSFNVKQKSMSANWRCPLSCSSKKCGDYVFGSIVYMQQGNISYTRPGQLVGVQVKVSFNSDCCIIQGCSVKVRVCQLRRGVPNDHTSQPPSTPPNLSAGVNQMIDESCGAW